MRSSRASRATEHQPFRKRTPPVRGCQSEVETATSTHNGGSPAGGLPRQRQPGSSVLPIRCPLIGGLVDRDDVDDRLRYTASTRTLLVEPMSHCPSCLALTCERSEVVYGYIVAISSERDLRNPHWSRCGRLIRHERIVPEAGGVVQRPIGSYARLRLR